MSFISFQKADKVNYGDEYNKAIEKYSDKNKYSYKCLIKECSMIEENIEYIQEKFSPQTKSIFYSGFALLISLLSLLSGILKSISVSDGINIFVVIGLIGLIVLIIMFLKWLKDEDEAILEQRKLKAKRDAIKYIISKTDTTN